jgi:hypothetical protein
VIHVLGNALAIPKRDKPERYKVAKQSNKRDEERGGRKNKN